MTKLLLMLLLLIPSTFKLTFAQTNYSANLGGTNSTNYFIAVPYETINNLIIIETIIEGDQYRFLFDTGAVTMISNKLYRKLEAPVLHKIPIYDYNEIVDTNKVVSLSHIVIGGIVFSNIPAVVNSDDSSIVYNCLEIDGIIGSNLLRNSIVRFSSREQIVYLTDTPERFNLNDFHASELFLSPLESIPYIWVAIKNNRQNRVQLIVDSGDSDFLSLSLRHFDILNKRSRRAPFHILSSSKGSFNMGLHGVPIEMLHYRLISNELVINQSVFTNITYNTSNSNNSSLGVKLFDYGIVTLDYVNKKFYFEPFFEGEKNLKEKIFGITPIVEGDKYIVGIVWDSELEGKINLGDQIIAIDEILYEGQAICEILKQPSPFQIRDSISITLKNKEGIINTVTLERRYTH